MRIAQVSHAPIITFNRVANGRGGTWKIKMTCIDGNLTIQHLCFAGRPHKNSFAFRYSGTSWWRTMDSTARRCGRIQFSIKGQCPFAISIRILFLAKSSFRLQILNDSHTLKLAASWNFRFSFCLIFRFCSHKTWPTVLFFVFLEMKESNFTVDWNTLFGSHIFRAWNIDFLTEHMVSPIWWMLCSFMPFSLLFKLSMCVFWIYLFVFKWKYISFASAQTPPPPPQNPLRNIQIKRI